MLGVQLATLATGRQRALRWLRAACRGVPAMSAKGRREGGSVPFDYYPTPAWCVDRLLDDCGVDLLRETCCVLEPTVGDGAIVRAMRARSAAWDVLDWYGCELRPNAGAADVCHLWEGDFRAMERPPGGYCLSVGNPTYTLAEAIVRHALSMSEAGAFLLRVGFLGSAERVQFWRDHAHLPFGLRVLPDRPSFDGEGTDSATYAWFVWGCEEVTGVKVLEPTPVEVRNAQKPSSTPHVDPRQRGLFEAAE